MEMTLSRLKNILPNVELVSFDIFDTLLSRRIGAPVDVFEMVRSKLLIDDIVLEYHDVIKNYPHLRRLCEQKARQERVDHFQGEGEITLDEIYAVFHRKTGMDTASLEKLKQTELFIEELVLFAPKDGKNVYLQARESGKTIAAISDMYLSREFLHKILVKNGYDIPLEMIFVSGEYRVSKHSGKLYQAVQEALSMKPSKWLHIGDNHIADINNAKAQGLATLHAHWSSVENIHIPSTGGVNDYAIASVVDFLETKQAREFFPTKEWEKVGYTIFGPLLFGYMLWLSSQLKAHGIEQALFMARDAQLMKKLFDTFFQTDAIQSEYVFGSRAALYPMSMTDWTMHRIWHLFGGKSKRTIREVFAMLGIDADMHIADIHQVGLTSADDLITEEKGHMMHHLINRLYFPIMKNSAKKREELNGYFLETIADHQNVALIDIGWSGNIQATFLRSISEKWIDKNIHGFYFGLFNSAIPNMSPYSLMKGWITSFENRDAIQHELTGNGGVEIMEFVLTADHGSTTGYQNINGKVTPVLEALDNEAEYNQQAMQVQEGIVKYFEDHRYLIEHFPLESLLSKEWMNPFLRLLKNPTVQEAEMIGSLTHSDTPGSNHKRYPLAPKVPKEAFSKKNKEYQEAYNMAYWKSGFLVRNG